jgi:Plasmid pRiA4b ORF-3-like protein
LVRSDSSIVDLHKTIQISFGWSGCRAFAFEVQGHRQGVRLEGDAREMPLADFRLYVKERFTYTYNTYAFMGWIAGAAGHYRAVCGSNEGGTVPA